ncbi:MAG: hypothetical protein AAGC55_17855, partial [Myxococcota bacterium]
AVGAGGEAVIRATFALDPFRFDLDADIRRAISVSTYLPDELTAVTGERLRGQLRVFGRADRYRIGDLRLCLGQARVTGEVTYDDGQELMHARRFKLRMGDSEVSSNGYYHVVDGTFNVGMRLSSRDFQRWLRRFGMPPVATGLDGSAQVTGTFEEPSARAELAVLGIPFAQSLITRLRYADDTVTIDRAEGKGLGGRVWAEGKVRLDPTVRMSGIEAGVERLDLSRLPFFGGALGGRLSARASANGPLSRLDSQLTVGFEDLEIAGDQYATFTRGMCAEPDLTARRGARAARRPAPPSPFSLRTLPSGETELRLCVARTSGAGSLSARANVAQSGTLSGAIELDAVPVHDLRLFGGAEDSPVGGRISASLDLSGTREAPTASGGISWVDSWFRQAFLGAGAIDVGLLGADRISVDGVLLQGDVTLSAAVHTRVPYETDVRLQLRRVGLDRFMPELHTEYGIRVWVTGELDARTHLLAGPGHLPTATLRLSEVEVWLDNEDSRGRPAPIRLRTKPSAEPVAVAFDGQRVVLKRAVTLIGPGGAELVLSGWGSAEELAVELNGVMAVAAAEPYLRDVVSSMRGEVAVRATVTGTTADPQLELDVEVIKKLAVQLAGQDAELSLPVGGRLRITNDQLTPTGLQVAVSDPYSEERAVLAIQGGVAMDDFSPTRLGLIINGEVSGKLMAALAPQYISRAAG